MSGYIGATPVPQATQHRQAFTATASQTSFATVGYTPQFVDVYLNGVKLAAADYTATNGSDIVLTTGAALNDILEIVAYTPFEVADQTFTGTTTVDVLSVTGAATGTDLTLSGGLYVGGAVAANYLDDYEEGTWTPVLFGTSTSGTATYATQSGTYTKIGNRVHVSAKLEWSAFNGTGALRVSGLPFSSAEDGELEIAGANITFTGQLTSTAVSGGTVIFLRRFISGDTNLYNVDQGTPASGTIILTGFYKA